MQLYDGSSLKMRSSVWADSKMYTNHFYQKQNCHRLRVVSPPLYFSFGGSKIDREFIVFIRQCIKLRIKLCGLVLNMFLSSVVRIQVSARSVTFSSYELS